MSATVHVVEAGRGPAVVWTHGVGDDHHTWDHQVERFEGQYRLLRWDLPGHGKSPVPSPADCTREFALTALAGVVDRAGPEPVVLAGHSLGGYLSLAYTLRHRERIRALVLVATGPGFRDPQARARWNEYVARAQDWFPDHPHVAGIAQQPDAEVIDGLERIAVPALLVVGSRDRRYHDGMAHLARKLPDAELVEVEDGGHHVQRQHADIVNDLIASFLAGMGV